MKPLQQGDVILREVNELCAGEESDIQRNHIVLAHGESGHSHVLDQEGARMSTIQGRSFLFLPTGATIQHEEHGAIDVGPGIWEVGRVQEYDYFQHMARNVQD